MKKKIETIEDVRDELITLYEEQRSGVIKHSEAKEMNNTMGKLIASAKVQLEYCVFRGDDLDIPFLGKKLKTKQLPAGA